MGLGLAQEFISKYRIQSSNLTKTGSLYLHLNLKLGQWSVLSVVTVAGVLAPSHLHPCLVFFFFFFKFYFSVLNLGYWTVLREEGYMREVVLIIDYRLQSMGVKWGKFKGVATPKCAERFIVIGSGGALLSA